MAFFLNELSLHNQFGNFDLFLGALQTVLQGQRLINQFGFRLYCDRMIIARTVFQDISFEKAILNQSDVNLKRKVRSWLGRTGPFWDDPPDHNPADYFEYENEPLDQAALAEAAFQIASMRRQCSLLSFSPSNFESPLLIVFWHKTDPPQAISVPNFWALNALKSHLEQLQVPIASWLELMEQAQSRFQNLIFSDMILEVLAGEPFSSVIAERVMVQLDILNRLTVCFDDQGQRTQEGHQIVEDHFQGARAIFSDESPSNKNSFRRDLTFRMPTGELIFCPFHGKISHRFFRLHFSWPIRHKEPIYIAYIGPKITKH